MEKIKKLIYSSIFLFILFFLIFLFVPACTAMGQIINQSNTSINNLLLSGELLGLPKDTSITVKIIPAKDIEAYIEYGKTSGKLPDKTQIFKSSAGIPLEILITPLQSDTMYFYRLNYRENGSSEFFKNPEYTFHTQRNKDSSFSFAVQADPHRDTNTNEELYIRNLNNILKNKPDFLIDLGDTFMTEKFARTEQEVIARYIQEKQHFDIAGNSVPLFLVNGNHEGENGWQKNTRNENNMIWSSNARNKYFLNPKPDNFYSGNRRTEPNVGMRGGYYSWEWGNALFVVLDPFWYSMRKPKADNDCWDYTLGKEQYDWFKNVLENSKAKYKFVFAHNVAGGSGKDGRGGTEVAKNYEWGGNNSDGSYGFDKYRPGWEKPIHQLMAENKVTIFFHGHDHFYAKQELDGVIYQLVPQPGSPGYNKKDPGREYGYKDGVLLPPSGFLKVSINNNEVTVEYIRSYLEKDENIERKNGVSSFTYSIK